VSRDTPRDGVRASNNVKALGHLVRTVATIAGTIVLLGGVVGGGFALFYGLETSANAKDARGAMAAECKEKRVEIRKEAKEERLLMRDWLKELLDKQHDETRESINELKEEIRYMRREFRNGRPR
jgi:gas vesicle protein